ncbi:MAG: ABC transporter ATP-binding protein [Acidimicrobiia bacterium]
MEARAVDKAFYGVKANDGVDFEIRWGEVHALLGENGAGKSTLCSILAGLYHPDGGEVLVDDEPVDFRTPGDALRKGVGMVYQHFRLVPNLTVAENLFLGHPELPWRARYRWMAGRAAELNERYGLPIRPDARVWQLSVGEQQRVEILKLLARHVRVLILDEPTAVLTPHEAEALFETVGRMRDEGRAVVLVTHKLEEVLAVADRVTVLRDGRLVGSLSTGAARPADLARMMVGRDPQLPERSGEARPGSAVLVVAGLRVAGDRGLQAVAGVDLEVRSGEIVGIAGVSGNGQRELAEAIAGLRAPIAGSVKLAGRDVSKASVLNRIQAGLGFVPEDRLGMGLAPGLPIEDNLALKTYRRPPFSRGPWLRRRAFQDRADELVGRFDVRGVRSGLPVRLLSGGNLQKALLARELSEEPSVLVVAAPTRGLDVGASEAVRELLLEQRAAGLGILLISEDLEEILGLADRILVMFEGRMVGLLTAEQAEPERIGLLMAGKT